MLNAIFVQMTCRKVAKFNIIASQQKFKTLTHKGYTSQYTKMFFRSFAMIELIDNSIFQLVTDNHRSKLWIFCQSTILFPGMSVRIFPAMSSPNRFESITDNKISTIKKDYCTTRSILGYTITRSTLGWQPSLW